jgi:hypothetical protein
MTLVEHVNEVLNFAYSIAPREVVILVLAGLIAPIFLREKRCSCHKKEENRLESRLN